MGYHNNAGSKGAFQILKPGVLFVHFLKLLHDYIWSLIKCLPCLCKFFFFTLVSLFFKSICKILYKFELKFSQICYP